MNNKEITLFYTDTSPLIFFKSLKEAKLRATKDSKWRQFNKQNKNLYVWSATTKQSCRVLAAIKLENSKKWVNYNGF